MWAWVLLPLEVALVMAAFWFYRQTKRTADMAQAAQTAWQTEVEAHLKSLVKELETLLDQANAQGIATPPARWFPTDAAPESATVAGPTPAAFTFEHVLDDALTETAAPVAVVAPTAARRALAEDAAEDPRYRAARRLHAAGADEVTIARQTGLEREEVQMLLQWSPAPDANDDDREQGMVEPEATQRKITDLVAYLKTSERVYGATPTAEATTPANGNGTRPRGNKATADTAGRATRRTPTKQSAASA